MAFAVAPARSGQPYAESICDSDANILFCEDFNYPANITCTVNGGAFDFQWINAGLISSAVRPFSFCGGQFIDPATDYLAKPQGAMPSGGQSDHVWVGNQTSGRTTGSATSVGQLRNVGGNYANGSGPVTDFYVRFQLYFSSNWVWPGDPKTDKYAFSQNCIDNKLLFVYPVEGLDQPTDASYDAGAYTNCGGWDPTNNARYADGLFFRVGTNSDNYKQFPLCAVCGVEPQHNEYAYQCTANSSSCWRDPHDVAVPFSGSPKVFRFDTNKWYTLEFRYKLSTSGVNNGTIEAWIDGTKIYSASDLETCTNTSFGDCSGLGAFLLMDYHNGTDTTNWDGQQVVDNLIISKAPIGVPNEAITPTLPGHRRRVM